ncbi:SET domain-containing protein [Hirsutella rhossiliensis]|uniref:SET domain-containing protein n=1 Tax=Hirsutella rhossiliensis TaxID=111463 RepID=A0A9P8SDQ4_9HYPO|nr:SET domain-containing protein [Hirsutella rhossiliensis]KAH0958846.1 SET domain-containing protein [Hirsutella rhossiliensis]
MSFFAETSSFSALTTDSSSNLASSGSTPPTTVADTASLHSDAASSKHDVITVADDAADAPPVAPQEPSPPRRARRARLSDPVYNLTRLSGTDAHGKRRAKGDAVSDRRRRTISGDTLVGSIEVAPDSAPAKKQSLDALLSSPSSTPRLNTPRTRRRARQCHDVPPPSAISSLGTKLSTLGKRGRGAVDKGMTKISRELRRLQDTNEFSGIDDRPVVHTVWSNGKYVNSDEPAAPARKRTKLDTPAASSEPAKEDDAEPITNTKQRRVKKFLDKGLYAGQDAPLDPTKGLTPAEKKKLAQLPELAPSGRVSKTMPSPIYTGLRTLIAGRDFRLPYNVCNPLPPGQPKPDEWKRMTKNRFIGDSKDYWRKTPHLHDYQSKCVCTPDDGCGESCQNRIMLYECDATNCNVGKQHCTNRAFADLTARRAKGGKYRVGVEVIKTSDRGYGVRSNRCFKPNQIIMEYAGEIITEEECERRMNEVYKDNECYYLMSFDQNMIIDATTGSIARFVNHSCNPNCRMIKWIVSGQPRMALFAGDRPIMTGDELTYDYNFDPFSAKNVQSCLCGEANCRGVLGPKPREVKAPKTDLRTAVKATVKAGKRKLKELIGDEADDGNASSTKKRKKIQPATKSKASLSSAGLKAAKGAAMALKKGVSTISVAAKKAALGGAKTPAKRPAATLIKKASAKKVVKTYGQARAKHISTSRASSLTIVAMGDENDQPGKKASPGKGTLAKKASPGENTPTKKVAGRNVSAQLSLKAKIRVVSQ